MPHDTESLSALDRSVRMQFDRLCASVIEIAESRPDCGGLRVGDLVKLKELIEYYETLTAQEQKSLDALASAWFRAWLAADMIAQPVRQRTSLYLH
jgi:hypothetical protein